MKIEPASPSQEAPTVLKRMRDHAKTEKELNTIHRFEVACTDVISGQALIMAKGKMRDTKYFRPNRMLVAESVDAYVTMRQIIDGPNSEWTGPKWRTIRGNKDMLLYIDLINKAADIQAPPRKGGRSYEIIDIISRVPDPSERAILMQVFEEGRIAVQQKNIAVQTLKHVAAIDLAKLPPKSDLTSILASASNNSVALNTADRKTFELLASTLEDRERLSEMGLVFRAGRLRMDGPPGTELIGVAAVSLIFSLAGKPLEK